MRNVQIFAEIVGKGCFEFCVLANRKSVCYNYKKSVQFAAPDKEVKL